MVKQLNKYNIILFDFDGVIVDSDNIRINAFRKTLKKYDDVYVDQFIEYHNKNGGISRYVKFEYFKNLTGASNEELDKWLLIYSQHCFQMMSDKNILIGEIINLISSLNNLKKELFVVSASDQNELRKLLGIYSLTKCFKFIYGSPVSKTNNISNLLKKFKYDPNETVLIGDSINDYEAAIENKISFLGFGNEFIKPSVIT